MSASNPDERSSPITWAALTVRFLLELALLVGVVAITLQFVSGLLGWIVALLAAAVTATLWGLLLSPKARIPLPAGAQLAIESALVVGVGAGLIFVGFAVPAIVGVAIWIVDRVVLAYAGRRVRVDPPIEGED